MNLYLSSFELYCQRAKIYKHSPFQEVFAQTGGRLLGLNFDSEGNLLVCDAYK